MSGQGLFNQACEGYTAEDIEELEDEADRYSREVHLLKGLAKDQHRNTKALNAQLMKAKAQFGKVQKKLKIFGRQNKRMRSDIRDKDLFIDFSETWNSFVTGGCDSGDCGKAVDSMLDPLSATKYKKNNLAVGCIAYRSKRGFNNWAYSVSSHTSKDGNKFLKKYDQGGKTYILFACPFGVHKTSMSLSKFFTVVVSIAATAVWTEGTKDDACLKIRNKVMDEMNKNGLFPTLLLINSEPGGYANGGYHYKPTKYKYHAWHEANNAGVFSRASKFFVGIRM